MLAEVVVVTAFSADCWSPKLILSAYSPMPKGASQSESQDRNLLLPRVESLLPLAHLESMQSGGAIPPPPPRKGVSQRYWRDTLRKQGKRMRYPPLRYYLERVLRDRGGYLALGR